MVQCSGEQNTRCATQIMSSGHSVNIVDIKDIKDSIMITVVNTVNSSDIVDSGQDNS